MKPHQLLDNSAAVYRSRITSVFKRNPPSRDHIKKKDGQGDILHNMPATSLSNISEPLEETLPLAGTEGEDTSSPNEKPHQDIKSVPQPKSRPKAAPRKKPAEPPTQTTISEQEKKVPLVTPRARPSIGKEIPPQTVVPKGKSEEPERKDSLASTKPSPKHREVSKGTSPAKSKGTSPAKSRTNSTEGTPAPQSPLKDPLKLNIRDKALLAQKVLMNTPDKPKPGAPPVSRKPRPHVTSADSLDPRNEPVEKAPVKSAVEDEDTARGSPMYKRKLPPGAFNMMGGMASQVHGQLHKKKSMDDDLSDEPGHTVSSPPPVQPKHRLNSTTDERDTDEVDLGEPASKPAPEPVSEPAPIAVAEPPPKPVAKPASVDNNVVLTWSPDVTATWLGQVGLASLQQLFLDREIQGYMLFDIDGHRLKVHTICCLQLIFLAVRINCNCVCVCMCMYLYKYYLTNKT